MWHGQLLCTTSLVKSHITTDHAAVILMYQTLQSVSNYYHKQKWTTTVQTKSRILQLTKKSLQVALTRWLRRMRYLVLCHYCLVTTYELTRTSHNSGQRLPSVHINFNATS